FCLQAGCARRKGIRRDSIFATRLHSLFSCSTDAPRILHGPTCKPAPSPATPIKCGAHRRAPFNSPIHQPPHHFTTSPLHRFTTPPPHHLTTSPPLANPPPTLQLRPR